LTREFLLEMEIPAKPPLLERCDIAAAEVERQADEFLKMTPVDRQET
jgi:hypothetical protein